jgi:hypothetical protein
VGGQGSGSLMPTSEDSLETHELGGAGLRNKESGHSV